MKSKLLPALASLIIGMAAGNTVYADTTSGMSSQTPSRWCSSEGPNAFEPNCASNNTMEREGKAAYGEPREVKMDSPQERSHFCSSEGPTPLDPKC